ncbi:MAG: hypothetical protein JWQ07_4116 [Ramlibacter sp.]|nr:hypothetical protein [Ramlibacter sp.]
MPTQFLVCALFHGDHPQLAERCSLSLKALRDTGRVDLRIGMNEVAPRSAELIRAALPGVEAIEATPQIYKYPMMRRLVHDYRGDATHVMWFDDDSCLQPGLDVPRWLDMVGQQAAQTRGALGSPYAAPGSAVEHGWIARQTWYTGRPTPPSTIFVLGAWFVLPIALYRQFDWPPTQLRHNGGDFALGALLYQQGLPVTPFRSGLAINADATLTESSAPRRGFSERPLGI